MIVIFSLTLWGQDNKWELWKWEIIDIILECYKGKERKKLIIRGIGSGRVLILFVF